MNCYNTSVDKTPHDSHERFSPTRYCNTLKDAIDINTQASLGKSNSKYSWEKNCWKLLDLQDLIVSVIIVFCLEIIA